MTFVQPLIIASTTIVLLIITISDSIKGLLFLKEARSVVHKSEIQLEEIKKLKNEVIKMRQSVETKCKIINNETDDFIFDYS